MATVAEVLRQARREFPGALRAAGLGRIRPEHAERWLGLLLDQATAHLEDETPADLAEMAATMLAGLARRKPGQVVVATEGRRILVVQEDRSFLVRSIRAWLARRAVPWRLLLHPVVAVRRGPRAELIDIGPADPGHDAVDRSAAAAIESCILVEADGEIPGDAARELRALMRDVRIVNEDFPSMQRKLEEIIEADRERGEKGDAESRAFLEWLRDGNFVFLGYRRYDIGGPARKETFVAAPGPGLGLMTNRSRSRFVRAVPLADARRVPVMTTPILRLGKATAATDIYRSGRLDFVGVEERSAGGRLVAEHRFYGVYADRASFGAKIDLPILRRRYDRIRRAFHAARGSYDDTAIVRLFSSQPIDSLLLTRVEDLVSEFSLTLRGGDERDLGVAAHYDFVRGGLAITLLVPNDRWNPDLQARLVSDLRPLVAATSVETRTVSDSADDGRVRLQVFLATRMRELDVNALVERIRSTARSWREELEVVLEERFPGHGAELAEAHGARVDDSYRVLVPPALAADDVEVLRDMGPTIRIAWSRPEEDEGPHKGVSYLRIFNPGERFALSDVTPILVHHGLRIVDEISFVLRAPGSDSAVNLQVYHVRVPGGRVFRDDAAGRAIAESVRAALEGSIEHDALCALMATAGLESREVALMRALRNYARQIGAIPARKSGNEALLAHPAAVRLLVEMFHAKFDPASPSRAAGPARPRGKRRGNIDPAGAWAPAKWKARIDAYLAGVRSRDDDRVLRVFQNILEATVRTNAFAAPTGEGAPWGTGEPIALKIDCSRILAMPSPRPWREIYVYGGPVMEGCHLRGGPVARGGLRWSERPDDFRTEILGLVKTQVTKNAQIVPTGAKGGFVLKRVPADRALLGEAVRGGYRMLVASMLAMQDNVRGGRVIRPAGVIAHDGDDPYLVVAADKGTATFSDTANALSERFGFWLGDAFASGGSNGYDHKKEGITARGAWVSVRRHFRALGRDIDREPFTAVGVGDMSGDVFGNGMLLARTTRLVAAFDHRDIFLDPNPDPARSFAERRRLFALPRSSWQDYDPRTISRGGGVWSRSEKAIPIAPEARAALGITAPSLDPDGLIRAILAAPVDLLYNGGIGTYVRASHELNAAVGDPQNDAVRVAATELRCRIVGEGGNLGFTQAARIEFALAGGRIITDAVDNAAGVDLSDHEVNLKILMDGATRPPRAAERTRLLKAFKAPIIADVLADNDRQTLAIALDEMRSRSALPAFARCLADLERRGVLHVALEGLPDSEVIVERLRAGIGLTQPELAVLLSWAKIDVKRRLMDSQIITRPRMDGYTAAYFAAPVRRRFAADIPRHRLRNEILVTVLTNAIVNFHGATVIHRLTTDCGLAASRVAEVLLVAHETAQAEPLLEAILACRAPAVPILHDEILRLEEAVLLAARWFIRTEHDIRGQFERLRRDYAGLGAITPSDLRSLLPEGEADRFARSLARRTEAGFPSDLAERLALLEHVPTILDILHLSRARRIPLRRVGRLMYAIGEFLRLGSLIAALKARRGSSEWDGPAAGDLVAELRHSRRLLTARILDLGGDMDAYFRERFRTTETIQSAIARVEAEEHPDLAPFVVIAGQIRNLAQL